MSGVTEAQLSAAVQTKLNAGGTVVTDGTMSGDGSAGDPLSASNANAGSVDGKTVVAIPATEDKLGPELVTNGDFSDGTTGWAAGSGATLSASGGVLEVSILAGDAVGDGSQNALVSGRPTNAKLQARGDGANGVPRLRVSGTIVWTGTSSTDWQTVDEEFTPAGAELSLLVVGDSATADSAFFRFVSAREPRTVPNTDKQLNLKAKQNDILWSEDLTESDWSVDFGGGSIANATDFLASTSANFQRFKQTRSVADDEVKTIGGNYSRGAAQWIYLQGVGQFQTVAAYFDLDNLALGGTSNADDAQIKMEYDGTYTVAVSGVLGAGNCDFRVYPSNSDGGIATYAGNGVDADVIQNNYHFRPGTIGDNIGYVTTTGTAAALAVQAFESRTDFQALWNAGFLQRADATQDSDGWEVPQESTYDGVTRVTNAYISPQQYLGAGKTVIRYHFTGANVNGSAVDLGLSSDDIETFELLGGWVLDSSVSRRVAIGALNDLARSSTVSCAPGEPFYLLRGSGVDDTSDAWDFWVDVVFNS